MELPFLYSAGVRVSHEFTALALQCWRIGRAWITYEFVFLPYG